MKNSSKSPPLAASPSSTAQVPTESPSSLATLSVHNEEVAEFDLVDKKCENQRYAGELPNKPHVYEEKPISKITSAANSIIETLNNLDEYEHQDHSVSFPLNNDSYG